MCCHRARSPSSLSSWLQHPAASLWLSLTPLRNGGEGEGEGDCSRNSRLEDPSRAISHLFLFLSFVFPGMYLKGPLDWLV